MLKAGQIHFLADTSAASISAPELTFDGIAIFGGARSKRYALQTEEGVVKGVFEQPDATRVDGELLFRDPLRSVSRLN